MDVFRALLRIARAVVESVIQTITQQINIMSDVVTQPLQAIVQLVLSGAWKGDGAARFAQEMSKEVIPELINIAALSSAFGGTIRTAVVILDEAENIATQSAQLLYDVFNAIYQ